MQLNGLQGYTLAVVAVLSWPLPLRSLQQRRGRRSGDHCRHCLQNSVSIAAGRCSPNLCRSSKDLCHCGRDLGRLDCRQCCYRWLRASATDARTSPATATTSEVAGPLLRLPLPS